VTFSDLLEQLRVPAGVEAVETAGEDGEGRTVPGGERTAVRGGVDPYAPPETTVPPAAARAAPNEDATSSP
jgi:hypothetical protein